jgi:TPR repeat protein
MQHRLRLSQEGFEQLLAWYMIRDTLLGHNEVEQDVRKAVALAAVCKHPNAGWLTKLFAGREVNTKFEAGEVFRGCENDPRADCFAAFLLWESDDDVQHAADLGDSYAQAWMAAHSNGEEVFRYAEMSAAQEERNGFYWLGCCYKWGYGCEKNPEKAKTYFLTSAELGSVGALVQVGEMFDGSDPQRFVWLGKAAVRGDGGSFEIKLIGAMQHFKESPHVIFVIGRILKGQIDDAKPSLFGNTCFSTDALDCANQAFQFYEFQLRCYRRAVDAWTMVALRKKVVKDIRKMIGKMIWDMREEAKYVEESQRLPVL